MEATEKMGVFLPCKVVVWEENGKTYISTINPYTMANIFDDPIIEEIGEKVGDAMVKVLNKMK